MAEPKYRNRIPPCPAYDIPAMESWLEDMAAKGLHLSKDGFFGPTVSFEEGPPRRERFRLEPTDTKSGLFSNEYEPEVEAYSSTTRWAGPGGPAGGSSTSIPPMILTPRS